MSCRGSATASLRRTTTLLPCPRPAPPLRRPASSGAPHVRMSMRITRPRLAAWGFLYTRSINASVHQRSSLLRVGVLFYALRHGQTIRARADRTHAPMHRHRDGSRTYINIEARRVAHQALAAAFSRAAVEPVLLRARRCDDARSAPPTPPRALYRRAACGRAGSQMKNSRRACKVRSAVG
jgi:hypothetical protein